MAKRMDKQKILHVAKNLFFIIVGCFLLAFGDAAFIEPLGLVTGGIISVGVIIQHFVTTFQIVDIVTWALQIILLVVSWFFLGKKFTLHTLLASLLYPLFCTLLYRIPIVDGLSIGRAIAAQLMQPLVAESGSIVTNYALTLLGGIAGGACVGLGVGLTYYGDGSTGGFDVISVILARKTPVKEALSAFVIDATLVIIGMAVIQDIPNGLIGVLSAFVCALMVQYVYVNATAYVIADIVSDKYEEIMAYVHETMDHASTVIDATGGYSGMNRKILRVAFSRRELHDFKYFIGQTDPRAFVTFTNASMINGEGFDPLVRAKKQAEEEQKSEDTADIG